MAEQENKVFFEEQKPTAIGWKVENLNELLHDFDELSGFVRSNSLGWVNERWLVTMHLRSSKLEWDIPIIKLMQRRPGSKDAVGFRQY